MPKCPKCKAEIDNLNADYQEWNRYIFHLKDGAIINDFKEVLDTADPDGDNQHYYCPECEADLFSRYTDAEAFLEGEEVDTRDD